MWRMERWRVGVFQILFYLDATYEVADYVRTFQISKFILRI